MDPASKANSPRKSEVVRNQGFFRDTIGANNSPLRRSLKPTQFLDNANDSNNISSSASENTTNLKQVEKELRFDLIKNLVKAENPDDG